MKISRTILSFAVACLASLSFAQAWSDAYTDGLQAIREGKWADARVAFKAAIAVRGEDFANPTRLPGPVTEQRIWRNGSPYSPNFGAAYAGFKVAVGLSNDDEKRALLRTIAEEFDTLLTKNQGTPETYFYLGQSYSILRDVARQRDLEARFAQLGGKYNWKIDPDILAPEDRASISQFGGTAAPGTQAGGTNPGGVGTPVGPITARVDKFALLIGNTESRIDALKVPFASSDAMYLREKLVEFSGYDEANIDIVANASNQQMLTAAQALSQRVTPGATVFLFFSGVGVNLDGKDFLAGVDTSSATDSASMIAKSELYKVFMAKGCKIFAFYQAHRPLVQGRYFGMETPMVGAIAQTQATLPNGTVNSIVRNGQQVGLFTDAIGGVLAEFRSNQVPINEFGWRVFNWMRGGRNGESGTGSAQTMTLPVIVNMLEDERF